MMAVRSVFDTDLTTFFAERPLAVSLPDEWVPARTVSERLGLTQSLATQLMVSELAGDLATADDEPPRSEAPALRVPARGSSAPDPDCSCLGGGASNCWRAFRQSKALPGSTSMSASGPGPGASCLRTKPSDPTWGSIVSSPIRSDMTPLPDGGSSETPKSGSAHRSSLPSQVSSRSPAASRRSRTAVVRRGLLHGGHLRPPRHQQHVRGQTDSGSPWRSGTEGHSLVANGERRVGHPAFSGVRETRTALDGHQHPPERHGLVSGRPRCRMGSMRSVTRRAPPPGGRTTELLTRTPLGERRRAVC